MPQWVPMLWRSAHGTNDEQGVPLPLPTLLTSDAAYTLTNILAFNGTGQDTTLYGWIDFDRNGTFDATEVASVPVPVPSLSTASTVVAEQVNLNWSGLSGLVAGQSYLRLRLTDQSVITAAGASGYGEVEDYALTIVQIGSLTVKKVADGGNGTFDFSSPQLGDVSLTTVKKTASQTFAGIAPGTYSITETVPTGWTLTGVTCDSGTPDSINVTASSMLLIPVAFAVPLQMALMVVLWAVVLWQWKQGKL